MTVTQLERTQTLGIDPRLILVIEFHTTIDSDEIHRNGMLLLDGSDRSAIVAFADDPALTLFHERLAAYEGEIPDGQKAPRHEAFFDAVTAIRPYGSVDRISRALADHVDRLVAPEELRLDVRCWHPEDRAVATAWLDDCRTAVVNAGGQVATVYQNDPIGLLVARVFLPSERLAEFAQLDVIASIDLLPATDLSIAEFHSMPPDDLPEMAEPARNAPVLGLIDSGVASAHPLLAGAVLAAETLSPHIADGEDRHGHGTMVASLALHGEIPPALRQARLVPIAKLVSVAVLDADGFFPDQTLWESDLTAAIEYCASMGARVINLSIGDLTRPFQPPRQPAVASIVDQLARQLDLVVVVSTGNSDPALYLAEDVDDPTRSYVADLLSHPDTGILPPGTAALALTVGGIGTAGAAGGYIPRQPAERTPFGEPGWPSTVTRRGRGIEDATKPELVAPSGTHGHEPGRVVVDTELAVIAASARHPGRLLTSDVGTSYAAPLVSRIALSVLARFPGFSANLTRALTILGAVPAWEGDELVSDEGELTDGARRDAVRRLAGYGRTSVGGALDVSPHRAILVAEGAIQMDTVHVYELPIPSSFYESGGVRQLDVALAFDPPTRSQRLDYLGNKLQSFVVRDIELPELLDVFTKVDPDEPIEDDEISDDSTEANRTGEDGQAGPDNEDEDADKEESKGLQALLGRRLIEFDCSTTERSRSANQLSRRTFRHRWKEPEAGSTYLVVRSINRWTEKTYEQPYALAVSLRRDPDRTEIYTELAAKLEAVAEIEVAVEVEVQPEIELGS